VVIHKCKHTMSTDVETQKTNVKDIPISQLVVSDNVRAIEEQDRENLTNAIVSQRVLQMFILPRVRLERKVGSHETRKGD
jgi:hypothetical protein